MNDAPLPNDPAARTTDGTLKDTTQIPEPTPDASTPPAVPETYSAFTAPEGTELDATAIEQATPIFKELGLDQSQAQKLVDFYAKTASGRAEAQIKAYTDMRADWARQTTSDPEIGSKLPEVKAEFGKALAQLPPKVATDLKAALDLTGAGDHPAVIKAMYHLSQLVNEGKHVSGAGPSKEGQLAPNTNARPTAAAALYPNLPH